MDGLVVGFDLDMTLIDSRPGVHATMCALAADLAAAGTDVVLGSLLEFPDWFRGANRVP